MGLYLLAFAISVVGATYASVPMYRLFCQMTGYGGTTRRSDGETVEEKIARAAREPETAAAAARREVLISFNADVADGVRLWGGGGTGPSCHGKPLAQPPDAE